MKILVTGVAGFIGSYVGRKLAERGDIIVGIDCINDYYDTALKFHRLDISGFNTEKCAEWNSEVISSLYPQYKFIRMRLEDRESIENLFATEGFDAVVNLAAQAGVRYSITNPRAYIESNIDGFINILEGCRHNKIKHLVYASSSSVYGLNGKVPFSEHDSIAHPVSLYAATKKSNELMAHAYSNLYKLPVTGLRFFTVYGPSGRPDMSPFLFADAILHDRPIKVFNNGNMLRDFTYIDDIVEGVVRILDVIPTGIENWDDIAADPANSSAPYRVYNIGNSQPVKLMDFISEIERAAGKEAKKEFLPMQPGDVYQTFADSSALAESTGFKPCTSLRTGIEKTVEWFRNYYKI